MNSTSFSLRLLTLTLLPFLTDCATSRSPSSPSDAKVGATASKAQSPTDSKVASDQAVDALDDYGDAATVSDPLERMNRLTFKLNDGLYTVLLRPVSKGYEFVTPQPMQKGLNNFFENLKFPVRFINSGLQGKFGRAGKEAQKFGINTVAGVGGFIRVSDKVASLADVPAEDTGQTLATWGMGHGPYLVLPVFGPSSFRDGIGYAGDYALNPVNWTLFLKNAGDWSWIPGTVNTVRSLPEQLYYYDEATANAVDPYLSVRSIYIQNRKAAVEQ